MFLFRTTSYTLACPYNISTFVFTLMLYLNFHSQFVYFSLHLMYYILVI